MIDAAASIICKAAELVTVLFRPSMRFLLLHLLAFQWLVSALNAANPILRGADPHAAVFEKQAWIYPTGGGSGTEFFVWSSKDFAKWEKHGPVFNLNDTPWVKEDGAPYHGAWALCAIQANKKYYSFFVLNFQ